MEIVLCDIMDAQQIDKAMDGVNCIIHCAKGSDESIIEGTRNMAEVALRKGVRRFVHISTTEVYGSPSGKITEESPLVITSNPYGNAKIEAEKVCWEYYKKGLPVTIIRPPIVYGPFSSTWTVNIATKLMSGNWNIFKGNADGICNLIYISDLVSGILLAAEKEKAVGQAFILNGPEALTWNEYFKKFNDALGLPTLNEAEPSSARLRAQLMEPVRSAAKFARDHYEKPIKQLAASFRPASLLMKSVEKSLKTSPRAADFALYNRQALYVGDKARELLGFSPSYNLDSGLKLTVPWLEQLGFINRI
jgi:nucleoside-diphosphate-sugar epimerase